MSFSQAFRILICCVITIPNASSILTELKEVSCKWDFFETKNDPLGKMLLSWWYSWE